MILRDIALHASEGASMLTLRAAPGAFVFPPLDGSP